MKVLILFSSLLTFCVYAQTEHVSIQKTESIYPNIAGVYEGKINYASLADTSGIVNSKNYKVIQYSLLYSDGKTIESRKFYGNIIPDSVCVDIFRYNLGEMIFFTEILSVGEDGRIYPLPSMNLIPVKEDER